MAKQTLGLGTSANDNTADTLTAGGDKINDNFGAIFGYTYQSKHIISNNNEVGYEPWKIDDYGNKYLGRDWEMRYYDLTREREAIPLIWIFL